jgi:hypothetical protein
MLLLCAGAELASLRWSIRRRPAAIALSGVMLVAVIEGLNLGPYVNEKYEIAKQALTEVPRGEPVMAFAVGPVAMWPLVEDLGLVSCPGNSSAESGEFFED